jgi:hypothetical protein
MGLHPFYIGAYFVRHTAAAAAAAADDDDDDDGNNTGSGANACTVMRMVRCHGDA